VILALAGIHKTKAGSFKLGQLAASSFHTGVKRQQQLVEEVIWRE
jgi:hypothetical protein